MLHCGNFSPENPKFLRDTPIITTHISEVGNEKKEVSGAKGEISQANFALIQAEKCSVEVWGAGGGK